MHTIRVIPCLDVDNGRVVKGVNFVDLIDAGDPNSPFKALLFFSVGTSQNVSKGPAYKGRFKKHV